METFAVVRTGGKQYRVQSGDTIRVESLPCETGDKVDLDDVLMVSRDGEVTLGTPAIPGAKVATQAVGHGKHKKLVVFKYKAKTRFRRKNGHRQSYTDLTVTDILI